MDPTQIYDHVYKCLFLTGPTQILAEVYLPHFVVN